MTVKKSQANALMDLVHQVLYNMIFTKDIDRKVFYYKDTWGETLDTVVW